jgi:hypothetical protein
MRVEASGERPCARTITFNIITEQVVKALATSVVYVRIQKDYYSSNCTITFNIITEQELKPHATVGVNGQFFALCAILHCPLHKNLPYIQPNFTRKTIGSCTKTFKALKVSVGFTAINSLCH